MNDELLFDDDDNSDVDSLPENVTDFWKVLIIDDEPEVHQITKLALVNFIFENKGLEFIHAYNAAEAYEILQNTPNIAMALLDVVMETDHAGLDLTQQIRNELGNDSIRIVLRTGQPGLAPERDIILNYDINDYVEKAELSAQKLFTVVVASLRAYRDILKLEDSRKALIKTNQNLSAERERIQVTLDSIGDAVVTTDENARVTHLNPVAEKLTGWSLQDAIGQPLNTVFKIINAQTRLTVDNPVEKVLETGNIMGLANHTILIHKDGTEFQIADSAAPIRNEAQEILGVILVCRDVTKEHQTEDALRRAQKMQAIGQLTGGIAHDFNNQLGIVLGYLDFLKDYLDDKSEASEWVKISSKATLRCTDLTRQLLSFSRTKNNENTLTNINSSLEEIKTMLARSVTPAIEIEYFLTATPWLTNMNQGEFQDAILNLVINARDAMPDGGKLIIETTNKHLDADFVALNPESSEGDFVQLVLSDTGVGMNKETQQRIFEPFYTTKPKGKGTGLGMAMVYGFMNRFDGFIKIYSELNYGTTLRLYLPRSELCKSASTEDLHIDKTLPTGNEVILIVDDEVDLLNLANKYLTELGYTTYLAENATQAMEMIEKHADIDCLFSDVVMPGGVNGYELAKTVTEQHPNIQVLLTSGFTSKNTVKNGQTRFTSQLLNKPYRKIELAQRIRLVLDDPSPNEQV